MRDALNPEGNWNKSFQQDNLSLNVMNQVLCFTNPDDAEGPDTLGWGGTNTYHFTF